MKPLTTSYTHDVVVIGASAGGVEALITLVSGLPKGLNAALFVVLHIPADSTSLLPRILARSGPLPAEHPVDGGPIAAGRIYVAPPDAHLILDGGRIRLYRGPKENSHRPAVDPLFRSAARCYGSRVIGVVLSGGGDDGTAGLMAIKRAGGLAVVQQPEEALAPGMPSNAAAFVPVDHCISVREIPALLAHLVAEPAEGPTPGSNGPGDPNMSEELDPQHPRGQAAKPDEATSDSSLSGFSCPECGGRLWEFHDHDLLRFQCRVGHRYSAETLLDEQFEEIEGTLWAAVNALEESSTLARRLSDQASERDHRLTAERFDTKARESLEHASVLRQVLLRTSIPAGGPSGQGELSSDPTTTSAAGAE